MITIANAILVPVELALGQGSLTILQALAMDRHFSHLKIPASSITVLGVITASVSLTLVDRFFPLLWQKVMPKLPTTLQRIGIGAVVTALAMAVLAVVEKRKLETNNDKEVMLGVWLFPQLIFVWHWGSMFYSRTSGFVLPEFPASLPSTATAVSSLIAGISYYLSTALIDTIRAHSVWLQDNINNGSLDNAYCVLVVLGTIDFGYFLCCANFFKYKQNNEKVVAETSSALG